MFNFDLKSARVYQSLRWEKLQIFNLASPLRKLFILLAALLLILYFLLDASAFLGLAIFSFVAFLLFWDLDIFFKLKVKNPEPGFRIEDALKDPEQYNLAEFLSFEAAKAADKALKISRFGEVNSNELLYFLLLANPKLNFVFTRALLNIEEIKRLLASYVQELKTSKFTVKSELTYSKDFQDAIVCALRVSAKKNRKRITVGDLLAGLAVNSPIFKKILIEKNLKAEDVENLVWWQEGLEEKIAERKKFWEYGNLMKRGTLAKQWSAGYTVALDRYSIDITDLMRRSGVPEIIGHKDAIESVERIVSRQEINNVLIVGEPGTGRKSIIQALAGRALLGKSLPEVNHKRVVELDTVSLLAQVTNPEEVEQTIDKVLQEAVLAGNVILVINEIHNYIGQAARPGVVDISGILTPYLQMAEFEIIGITTYAGLHQNIEKNPSILSLFEKVEVAEISEQETMLLLENLTLTLERKYKKLISYPALREIVSLTERYLPALPLPEKALNLLDEVVVYAAANKDLVVLPQHVAKIITEKTQIPVGQIETKEKQILLNLEKLIHERIINQEEAVSDISTALRRARADITIRKGPMGCFLFLGPTGVGKTETSKVLAEIYFGGEEKMIRLDMSEFQAIKDIPRLIGSPEQQGLLTTPVRENPFSLVLLDEFEKAHSNILNLFLQVFDEGSITDGLGRKVDFKNTILIATSNAGYKVILDALKENTEWQGVKQRLLDYLFKEAIFRPELINRFDGVVVFKSLTKENLLVIAELLLQKLKGNLKQKEIEFVITQELKEKIAELGYNPVFGAREMRRVIQEKVENPLAIAILEDKIKKGYKVEVEPEKFSLIINP